MRISSTIAEWQIEEFIVVLKKNRIKKGSPEWVKHLVMFGESRGINRDHVPFDHDTFLVEYKSYWRLK